MLRNKRVINVLLWQGLVLWILCSYIIIIIIKDGTRFDHQTNDFLINTFLKIPKSDRIVYLSINDNTYKNYFKSNQFDRKLFAEALDKLRTYNPEAIILDLVFAYPSNYSSDSALEANFGKLNNLILPVSFAISKDIKNELISPKINENSYLNRFISKPIIKAEGIPYLSGRGLLTSEKYLNLSAATGHISDFPDEDGIYRNSLLLIKINDKYLPSLYFSAFLKEINVPFNKIEIFFGDKILIPVLPGSWNNEIIEIPIDESGRTRIAFVENWTKDFPNLSLINFSKLAIDDSKQGSLNELFEGKFVFLCDVSTGIADIGTISLNQTAPLVVIQANMLNSLLTNTFFNSVSSKILLLLLFIAIAALTFSTFFTEIKIFYYTSICLLVIFTSIVFIILLNHHLLPVISMSGNLIFSFVVLLIQVEYFTQKDKKYIEIDNLRKQHEMDEARKIQLSMLPAKLPIYDGLDIATYMSTATEVGGDYYDFYLDKNNYLNFVIADATGHGLQAGTMVTVAKTLFIISKNNDDYLSLLNKMSGIIKQLNLFKLYLCLALFKIKNNILEFTSAGMPPIYWYQSKNNFVEKITLKGSPLGFLTNFPYEIMKIELHKGDVLLISSDGLTELFNEENEMLSEESITSTLQKNGNDSAEIIISKFKSIIKLWCGKIEPKDDISIIVIRVV